MNTIEIPKRKFIVSLWPNNNADPIPVKIVATVDEYFFKIVSAKDHDKFGFRKKKKKQTNKQTSKQNKTKQNKKQK